MYAFITVETRCRLVGITLHCITGDKVIEAQISWVTMAMTAGVRKAHSRARDLSKQAKTSNVAYTCIIRRHGRAVRLEHRPPLCLRPRRHAVRRWHSILSRAGTSGRFEYSTLMRRDNYRAQLQVEFRQRVLSLWTRSFVLFAGTRSPGHGALTCPTLESAPEVRDFVVAEQACDLAHP